MMIMMWYNLWCRIYIYDDAYDEEDELCYPYHDDDDDDDVEV
jgi:hypothetical protein